MKSNRAAKRSFSASTVFMLWLMASSLPTSSVIFPESETSCNCRPMLSSSGLCVFTVVIAD